MSMKKRTVLSKLIPLVTVVAFSSASTPARADDDNAVTIAGTVLAGLGLAGGLGAVGCTESSLHQDPKNTCIGVTAGLGALFVVIGIPTIIIGTRGASIVHSYHRDPDVLRGVGLTVGPNVRLLSWLRRW